jgi:2-polyprenyl-6-methoxyphenol hydroxylase-like FAD-dependent oxidoreductase
MAEGARALEQRAEERYRAVDYAGAVDLYEAAYRAYREDDDRLGAGRAARVVAWLRGPQSRFHTVSDLPGSLRTPYGPGWALVGDAGYTVDPSTAQGISDAFLDAEGLTGALDDALCGRRSFDDAMADCHRQRDEHVTAMYELTSELATQEPLPPELARLLTAASASQSAMDAFAEMFAGVLPVPAFFAPEHVERILRAAA